MECGSLAPAFKAAARSTMLRVSFGRRTPKGRARVSRPLQCPFKHDVHDGRPLQGEHGLRQQVG
jgi:hypothetical protein